MIPDKLKNLFKRTTDSNDEESLFERATQLIHSNRRILPDNPLAQFQTYLEALPWQDIDNIKNKKPKPKRTATLRPQLTARCYQHVPKLFFSPTYQVTKEFFTHSRRETGQKVSKMHEYLDEVEICLFNQISSRFDEILAVLRTIESLQCVVDFNAERLKTVRSHNISVAKVASQRHLTIVSLLKRQDRLKRTLDHLAEVKIYTSFLGQGAQTISSNHHSQIYEHIAELRMRRDLYFQLHSTNNFEGRVQELQANLKKSYSDSINDAFFKYVVEVTSYDPSFWQQKFHGRSLFEVQQQQEGTVILDESMLVEEELSGVRINVSQEQEKQIVNSLVRGWRDGEYGTGPLKIALQLFLKEKYHVFLSDCRNFCFQTFLREQRGKMDNPNITNLLQLMNVSFCSRVFQYHADCYRPILTRSFSLISRALPALQISARGSLTIQQKDKITFLIDELLGILGFVFRAVYEKVLEAIDLKNVYDSMELQDFKQLINVLETEQDFINKQLKRFADVSLEGSFLGAIMADGIERLDLQMVRKAKQEKVLSFLNRTHRYIIENQLRDSFEQEVWKPTDIPTFYYDSLHYLITGESLNLRRNRNHTIRHNLSRQMESSVFIDRLSQEASLLDHKLVSQFRIIRNQIIINQRSYKVTGTLLLLLEFIEDYMHLAQFYSFLSSQVGFKIYQLLRAYHSTSHQLIFLAGAVKLQRIKTKTITARHLALNSLCLSFLLYIMNCLRDRVPIHDQQKIRSDIQSHEQNIIKRLASILSGKYSQALPDVNFGSVPSKGTEIMVNSTKNLHDILADFYQADVMVNIFVRGNVDTYLGRLEGLQVASKVEAQSLKDDMNYFFTQLKFLEGLILDFKELRLRGEDIVRIKFQQL